MIDLPMNFPKLSFTESSASGAAAVASKAKQKERTKTEKVTRRTRRNRMRVLIPQICVASGLLEIFQKMQLRGRRNGRKHRVVGSSHRKRKKEEAAGDDASSSSSSNDDDTRDLGYAATTKAKGRIRVRVSPFVVFFRPQTKLVRWVLSEGSQAKSDVACSYRLYCGRSS
jgi:hypothetical protein